jgi:hypothetical protein
MKKIVALFLIGVISACLFACNSNGAVSSKESDTISSNTVSSKVSEPSNIQSSIEESENSLETGSSQIPSDKEFSLTQDEYIKVMDKWLKIQGETLLSEIKPEVETVDWPGTGIVDQYTYVLDNRSTLALCVDKNNNNLVSIILTASPSVLTSNETDNMYIDCASGTVSYMAGDESKEVIEELNLGNGIKNGMTTASTKYCSFSYSVNDDSIILIVDPN